jgi:hypothetical protein
MKDFLARLAYNPPAIVSTKKEEKPMKRVLSAVLFLAVAASALAQHVDELNEHARHFPAQGVGWAKPGGGGPGQNISYHGGDVLNTAHVFTIFWGSQWNTAPHNQVASEMTNFILQFGGTGEYNTIGQYWDGSSSSPNYIQTGISLSAGSWVDTTPPTSAGVTDAMLQAEVQRYLAQPGAWNNDQTVYQVMLPNGFYSTDGGSTSCGGPNLQYCAYHYSFNFNGKNYKYSSMPYPSCSGCRVSGWTDAQNLEHFACHEVREAVTDANGSAWFDHRGYEADDKCAWSPTPFIGSGGYGYQYEWSNEVGGCVRTR